MFFFQILVYVCNTLLHSVDNEHKYINFFRDKALLYILFHYLGSFFILCFSHLIIVERALSAHWEIILCDQFVSYLIWLFFYIPVSGGQVKSTDFDSSLLYKLIRNTLNHKIAPPTSGWGTEPLPGDRSEADDIERIRCYRNKIAHNTEFKISNKQFLKQWEDLSKVLYYFRCSKAFVLK